MEEIWKEIPTLEGRYEASNFGRIRHFKTKRVRMLRDNGSGYKIFMIKENGINKNKYVHRCVLLAFMYREDHSELDANHKNFKRENNNITNLEWTTRKQNINYSKNKGRYKNSYAKHSEYMKDKWANGYNPFNDDTRKRGAKTRKSNYKKELHPYYGKMPPCATPKRIIQYTINMDYIKEWETAAQIQRELGFWSTNISQCCKGRINHSFGFKWEFKDTPITR